MCESKDARKFRLWLNYLASLRKSVVPAERIELPTFGLQNRCTTAVLRRPRPWLTRLETGCKRKT